MTRAEIVAALRANLNKAVQIELADGTTHRLMPLTVGQDGFIFDLASSEDAVNWMGFDEVHSVVPENASAKSE